MICQKKVRKRLVIKAQNFNSFSKSLGTLLCKYEPSAYPFTISTVDSYRVFYVSNDNFFRQKNIMSSPLNDNKVMETVDVPNNEAELRLAFARQTDELRLVRRQLANSQLRVKELEDQVRKLQRQ